MIQSIVFTGSNTGISVAARIATKQANTFFSDHKVSREMIVSQTTNSTETTVFGSPWATFTLAVMLDMPYEINQEGTDNTDEPVEDTGNNYEQDEDLHAKIEESRLLY